MCLQALRRDLPFPDPLVASATYLRPAATGPAEVHTEVVRAGRRVATGEARLIQGGKETVRVVATFGDLDAANGRTEVHGAAAGPAAAGRRGRACRTAALPGVTHHRAPRLPRGGAARAGRRDGRPATPSWRVWMRFRDGREADPLALTALVDAAAPAVLELGAHGSATIQLTVHVRGRPAPGWLACRATTRYLIGGYHEEDFEIWDSEGRLVAQSRQFALLAG